MAFWTFAAVLHSCFLQFQAVPRISERKLQSLYVQDISGNHVGYLLALGCRMLGLHTSLFRDFAFYCSTVYQDSYPSRLAPWTYAGYLISQSCQCSVLQCSQNTIRQYAAKLPTRRTWRDETCSLCVAHDVHQIAGNGDLFLQV